MMRKPNNWNDVQAFSDRQKLPVGAYIVRVHQALVEQTQYGESLSLLFDIVEGEYANYYSREYASVTTQNKRWKGVIRQFLPKDDGSEKDDLTKSCLKGLVTAFEHSNPGFVFDWNENSFTGKLVGILYRNEEWEYNGKTGWAARPFRAISVDRVREGNYTIPKDKPLQEPPQAQSYAPPFHPAQQPQYGNSSSQFPGGYNASGFRPIQSEDDSVPF